MIIAEEKGLFKGVFYADRVQGDLVDLYSWIEYNKTIPNHEFDDPAGNVLRDMDVFFVHQEVSLMQYEPLEKWIWLPEKDFPDRQTTTLTSLNKNDPTPGNYTVVRAEKRCGFVKPIREVHIRASADAFFRLNVNGHWLMSGPAAAGSDFIGNELPRPQHYATEVTVSADYDGFSDGKLDFDAIVRMKPGRIFESSAGRGGFMLTAQVRFADDTKAIVCTDESWQMTLLPAYREEGIYDGSYAPEGPVAAQRVANVWHCLTAPIPPCDEILLTPQDNELCIAPGQTAEVTMTMDMIYTGYPVVHAECAGRVEAELQCVETEEVGSSETYVFCGNDAYAAMSMHSARKLVVKAVNRSDAPAKLTVHYLASCYPVRSEAVTKTNDDDLNLVLKVCTHTLKNCRQTLHLDSGRHCEPLACTGDYYIESLMTAFTFGDMRLASFDVRRTAELLRYADGELFHTTYSMIWVQMLWDVYRITGEEALLRDCEDALTLLLARFERYIGDTGLVETPVSFMFVDWLYPDDISLHHPPKALGQTCLNMFCYGGLCTAARIYETLGEAGMSCKARQDAEQLKKCIFEHLYDKERGLFFEGLNTPTPEHLLWVFMPQNVDKRYFRKHANILAAYFSIMEEEECRRLLHTVMVDDSLGQIQPYFAHFLLEAVYRCGLRDAYTLRILQDWKAPVLDCPYGLAEGFIKPEPTYSFDHSHAWGGTPSYALPLALTGLEILEPGYKKIRLAPSLLGLESAYVEIPTPCGNVTVKQRAGEAPEICVPDGIELV